MRATYLFLLAGLACSGVSSTAALAQTAPTVGPAIVGPYADWLTEAASRFALPLSWIRAVLRCESAGRAAATSPKGAMGLMQIMPATWGFLRDQLRLGGDPYDPHDNIIAGAAYIRMLVDRYGSPGWIAAYNAGPGRYEASLSGRPLPAETRAYAATVAAHLDHESDIPSANPIAPVPQLWTHAQLFIARTVHPPIADRTPQERSPDDASAASRARDDPAMAARSDGLFVVQSGTGTTP